MQVYHGRMKVKFARGDLDPILKVIEQNDPVETPELGFERVNTNVEGTFAFIHDAAEVRYQYYQNCNFTTPTLLFSTKEKEIHCIENSTRLSSHVTVPYHSKTIFVTDRYRYTTFTLVSVPESDCFLYSDENSRVDTKLFHSSL